MPHFSFNHKLFSGVWAESEHPANDSLSEPRWQITSAVTLKGNVSRPSVGEDNRLSIPLNVFHWPSRQLNSRVVGAVLPAATVFNILLREILIIIPVRHRRITSSSACQTQNVTPVKTSDTKESNWVFSQGYNRELLRQTWQFHGPLTWGKAPYHCQGDFQNH